jgi:hypothetical protein
MYISKFQVLNYKSYRDSTEIELKRGFNILTGQNSAGKTALLEALALDFKAAPQVSDATVPFRGASPDANSFVRLTFVISGSELVQLVRSLGLGCCILPLRGWGLLAHLSSSPGIQCLAACSVAPKSQERGRALTMLVGILRIRGVIRIREALCRAQDDKGRICLFIHQ